MAHFYPYFVKHQRVLVDDPITFGVTTNTHMPTDLVEAAGVNSTNLYGSSALSRWAIGVDTTPSEQLAASLTVGGTLALGLLVPNEFNVAATALAYTPTAFVNGRTVIGDATKLAQVPTPPQLWIDSGSVTDPALGVKGTSNFQGNAALAGDWHVKGRSRLRITDGAPAELPGYTLDVDGKIRLTRSIAVLEGTVQVPNPPNAGNIAALWQIRGNGVKFHDNSPPKDDDPLVTVNEFGEVTIHKALTVVGTVDAKGTVKATTVEAGTVKAKLVDATDGTVKAKLVDATGGTVKAKTVDATGGTVTATHIATATLTADFIDAVRLDAFNLTVKNKITAKNVTVKKKLKVKKRLDVLGAVKAAKIVADRILAKRAKIGPRGIIRPPPHPARESGSYAALKVVGGFIGQTMSDNFIGSGKYIVMGQCPPIGIHGGRYGITIRNGGHFCSLRVIKAGDTILSWGHADRVRFRYEGHRWSEKKHKYVHASRDIVSIERRGRVLVYGGITASAYGKNCDERFKEAITPLDGALDKVLAMRGVSYLFREDMFDAPSEDPASDDDDGEFDDGEQPEHVDFSATMTPERRPQLGLIAQEVEKVCPEMISTDDEGYKTLDISQLNPLLLEAIKEQQGIIEAQNSRIAALERAILAKKE